jgi:hypothetical protein
MLLFEFDARILIRCKRMGSIFIGKLASEGYFTASTCKLRGAKPACRRSVPLERNVRPRPHEPGHRLCEMET